MPSENFSEGWFSLDALWGGIILPVAFGGVEVGDGVEAVTAAKEVTTEAAGEGVVAGAAAEQIRFEAAAQGVVAGHAEEHVEGVGACQDLVGTGSDHEVDREP